MRGFRLDDRLIFPELNIVVANGVSVHVEPKVMQVLVELARYPGELISKAQILETVWAGLFVCDDVVANAVSLLRRALGDTAKHPALIQTIPKRGYRVLCAVEPIASPGIGPLETDLNRCLLRVRHLRHEETELSLRSAHAYAEDIINQAPDCVAAYAELALTLFSLLKLGAIQRRDTETQLRSAVEQAVRLDGQAGVALVCLAKLESRFDGYWQHAERHLRRALQAGWHDAEVLTECSTLLSAMRRFEESMVLAERACMLDPISPAARLQVSHAYSCNAKWEAAVASYRRVLKFSPQHLFARWGLAYALILAGQPHEAISTITPTITHGFAPTPTHTHPMLVTPLLRARDLLTSYPSRAAATEELQFKTSDPVLLVELYGWIGATDKAFEVLDEAADMMHYRISAVNMFPQFGPIREDARYARILERVGLSI